MTPQEKAKWLAEFYGAVTAGKTAQVFFADSWHDQPIHILKGPAMLANPENWRIKPEPRRMWRDERGAVTTDKEDADAWKRQGHTVTEWVEVV